MAGVATAQPDPGNVDTQSPSTITPAQQTAGQSHDQGQLQADGKEQRQGDKDNNTNPSAPADGKKDRKPRRERLPLPDPIPDTPVKRYSEPSKLDVQTRVEAEDAKLQLCFDRLNSVRSFYDQRQKIREAGKPEFEKARKEFTDLNEQCRQLFEEKKGLTFKLKAIKDANIAARSSSNSRQIEIPGAGRDNMEALKDIRTMEDLDQRIAELEYRQETHSMPMPEEKKLIATISFLQNKARDHIQSKAQNLKDEKAKRETREASRTGLEDARKSLDTAIDNAKEKVDAQKKVVDEIRAKQDKEIQQLQSSTSQIDRDAEKSKIGDIKAVIKKIRDDYQVQLDKWYLNERIHYEQQKIAKRKKYEAMQADRDARRKEWEAEQAQYPEPHPYQEEKDMCSGLTVYLQTILGETVDKPAVNLKPLKGESAPSLKTSSNARQISSSGTTIGKSTIDTDSGFETLAFSDFVKKSGKSKSKKGRGRSSAALGDEVSQADDSALKPHSIDLITAFTKLDIKPPNRISEVRIALEAVRAKAAYYETAPAPSEEEKAQKAEAKKKPTPRSEKPRANGVGIGKGETDPMAFPGLKSASAAPAPALNSSMPSFMAVASGEAQAPPPILPVVSSVMEAAGEVNDEEASGLATEGTDGAMNITQAEPSLAEA